jgi:hypothetical protein
MTNPDRWADAFVDAARNYGQTSRSIDWDKAYALFEQGVVQRPDNIDYAIATEQTSARKYFALSRLTSKGEERLWTYDTVQLAKDAAERHHRSHLGLSMNPLFTTPNVIGALAILGLVGVVTAIVRA